MISSFTIIMCNKLFLQTVISVNKLVKNRDAYQLMNNIFSKLYKRFSVMNLKEKALES